MDRKEDVSLLTISRGKVNAINVELVSELSGILRNLEADRDCKSIVLTGSGSFFSFGFDIPELLIYTKDEFIEYLTSYNSLIKHLFLYPKPVIASINGHCIAGGCVMALACDYRIMCDGRSKISMNEISFGSTLFSSAMEILKYTAGERNAERILISGEMFNAQDAFESGLVDEVCPADYLSVKSIEKARQYTVKDMSAFYSLKRMSRMGTLRKIDMYEEESLREFVEIWYSPQTREKLKKIEIHG